MFRGLVFLATFKRNTELAQPCLAAIAGQWDNVCEIEPNTGKHLTLNHTPEMNMMN